jgi:D-arabinose 1-dehydrogenase-like Zn-dependent alcohol dehydrogenase
VYTDHVRFLVQEVLARNATIVPLSAPTGGPISLPAGPCFWNGYHLHSSLVAPRAKHDDMLNFAARHDIKPQVELYEHTGADNIEKIIERLGSGKVRYRAVLVAKQ